MDTYSKTFNVGETPSRLEIDVTNRASLSLIFIGGAVAATGFAAAFEASLDSNSKETGSWTPVNAQASDSTITASQAAISLATGVASKIYKFDVSSFKRFRVRTTALTTGNVIAVVQTTEDPTAFVPIAAPTSVSIAGNGTTSIAKAEDAAHTSGDLGVPNFGVRAPNTPVVPTSAAGDYGYILLDQEGKQIIANGGSAETSWQYWGAVAATDTAVKASGGAGIRNYITDVIVENNTAATIRVIIKDGNTAVFVASVPPNSTFEKSWKTPIKGTAATVINVIGGSAAGNIHLAGFVGV